MRAGCGDITKVLEVRKVSDRNERERENHPGQPRRPPPLLSRRGVWTRVDAVGKASLPAQHCGKPQA